MPKNPNIKKVLVIGSGPIVIGQAAEFDYAGTQACRSLKEEGIEVVLVMSLSGITQKSAVFVSPSPFTPIPISDRLSSSLESNRKTCLFSRNASLELALMIMERTVSPAPLIHLLYCFTAG